MFDDDEDLNIPPSLTMEISPTTITYTAREMAHYIAAEAARQVVSSLEKKVKEDFRGLLNQAVLERVGPVVQECMDAPIQKTNSYGEPVGSTLSMRELILESAQKYLGESVNRSGYPERGSGTQSRAEHFIAKVIDEQLGYAMKKQIEDAVKKAIEEARTRVAAVIAPLLANIKL